MAIGPDFVAMLNEPKNTLGRTEEVVALVLADPSLVDNLYACYFQPDEWVRLRVSSSFKRLWRAEPDLVLPLLAGFVDDVSTIDQPSTQWTFAQMCLELDAHLSDEQREKATSRIKGYLAGSDDWIVQNASMDTLGKWADADAELRSWLDAHLTRLASSHRKSVARRAAKWKQTLATEPTL